MYGRRRADTRLGDLGRDVDLEPKLLAQLPGCKRICEPAELDELQRYAPRAGARVCLDVSERMNALVNPDRHFSARQRLEPGKVVVGKRLFDKRQLRLARAFEIAPGGSKRQPAIRVGAERRIRQRRSNSVPRRHFSSERLHADLQLEEIEAFGDLGKRLRNVLLARG